MFGNFVGTYLTLGLVLELVVLADPGVTRGTAEHPAAMAPHVTLALAANRVAQRALACVRGEALPGVANSSFAEVAHSPDERKA